MGSLSKPAFKILSQMGYDFSILTADIDEKSIRKDRPEELVTALAQAKANAIVDKLGKSVQMEALDYKCPTLLLTADTVVVYKGIIQEKPTSMEEARKFIEGYSGSHAAVVGSVLVTNLTSGKKKGAWERAEVYFYQFPDDIIDTLLADEITYKVAGALTVEHPLTSRFVESVVGNIDAVMGLPIALTEKLIEEAL